ncbi:hypothetical protein VTK56DRAFT_8796 [Thermocarpiscus australiensis]
MNVSRTSQRRSPGAEPGPPPSVPARALSPGMGVGTNRPVAPRPSTTSRQIQPATANGSGSRNDGTRRTNSSGSSVPLSQIEKSVTHLLVATKQLLETLTQWSRGNATDTQVSDVYVRLGYEFNMACRAFTAINVDTSDLGNVPELLRSILEATLSQEASPESLERYLPKIRDIIINLLHGLKRKQTKLRQKQQREREMASSTDQGGSAGAAAASNPPVPARTTSASTTGSVNSGLTTMLNESLEEGYRPESRRDDGRSNVTASPTRRLLSQRDQSRGSLNSEQSSLSSTTMQNIPVLPPYPGDEMMPTGPSASELSSLDNFPPPPPPPKASQQSALAALQRGGDLERRASRRYSAYQISKLVGAQAGIPMLPPQTTPIPNRGRGEVRESMRAMQARDGARHKRNTSSQSRAATLDSSPVRVPSRVSEEPEEPHAELPAAKAELPAAQLPEDKYQTSATLTGPPVDAVPVMGMEDAEREKPAAPAPAQAATAARAATPDKQSGSFTTETPPRPTKELTLFLQYKSKVKKFVLPEGYDELSIGRLQLAFIEKFSWNTQQNGADLPDIYIQDPISGVRHELEDLSDIKDRTVLVLNVEPLDEVKKHIDDGLSSLKQMVRDMKQNLDDQGAALQRVSERQQETAKDVARLAAAPPPTIMTAPTDGSPKQAGAASAARKLSTTQLSEIQSLRRDLAVLRQTYSNFQSEIQGSMSALRNKANNVKAAAARAAVPDMEGDSGRAYVANGRKKLNADSDRLVNKVDDLQDLVEDLRKDVVHRGVRPLPRQLEAVTRDIALLTKELTRMEEYMRREKPVWTKVWEKELEDVCQGRDELRLMEDLMVDLRDDLEKASETFALVEQATKEQMKDAGGGGGGAGGAGVGVGGMGVGVGGTRQFSKGLSSIRDNALVDPTAAKEGVLGEVRALRPNHENRLEAIERAEKLRQKELASRRENPLMKELATFVEEGRLKKSGGVEEVERARKAKDDRIRREVWERQNGILPADPVGGEEEDGGGGGEEVEANGTAEAPAAAVSGEE